MATKKRSATFICGCGVTTLMLTNVWRSMKHVYCTPVITLWLPELYRQRLVWNRETIQTPKRFNQSTYCPLARSWCPHLTARGTHGAENNKRWSNMILKPPPLSDPHACINHPAHPPPQICQMMHFQPLIWHKLTGATFDKCKHIVFISEDLEKFCRFLWEPVVVVEVPNVFAQRKCSLRAVLHT